MVEQALEELGVALGRHALVGDAREVALVIAHEDRHAAGDGGVDLVGRGAPLLHRVVEEHVLVDVVGDLLQVGVVLLAQLENGNLLVLTKGLDELAVEGLAALLAKGELEALVVERDRHESAVDVGEHLVLVVGPLGEAGEELVDAVALGVVDVRTVLVDQDARVVDVVIGVARDVVATLDDGDAEAAGLGKAACADGASVTGTDDDHVVRVGVEAGGEPTSDTHSNPLDKL